MRVRVVMLAAVVAASLVAATPAPAIVRGANTSSPWLIGIHTGQTPTTANQHCSGALVAPQWVLTAKHCLDTNMNGTIGAGEFQPTALWFNHRSELGLPAIQGVSAVLYPQNDLALVRLLSAVGAVDPLQLATAKPAVGATVTVFGWGGATQSTGKGAVPSRGQEAQFKVTGVATATGPDLTYRAATSAETCGGDDGGPVVLRTATTAKLVAVHTNSPAGCGVNTGNAAGSRIETALAWVRGIVKPQFGWAVGTQPGTALYSPSNAFSYNSTGGAINIKRTGTGLYEVEFAGLAPGGDSSGNPQVSSYGVTTNRCVTSGFYTQSQSLVLGVVCRNAAGTETDGNFVAQWYRAGAGNSFKGGYTFTTSDGAPQPSVGNTYNSKGGAVQVAKESTGVYSVKFVGFTGNNGTVAITSFGRSSPPADCNLDSWAGDTIYVACVNPSGVLTDERFSVRFTAKHTAAAYGKGAYAFANGTSSAVPYEPPAPFAYKASAGAMTIQRLDPGLYQVYIPNMKGLNSTSALVTAHGNAVATCHARDWIGNATEVAVNVLCQNHAGAPLDSQFTLSYLAS